MKLRILATVVAFLTVVPATAVSAQEPIEIPSDLLESLGTTAEELLGTEPNPAWDALGLFSPDAERILEAAGEPADFITYAFGDDPTGTPVITPSGTTPVARGSMLWRLDENWTPPPPGLTGSMAFAETGASQLSPGETVVLMWVEMDGDFDFTSGATINEGFPLTIPGAPVWRSTFAGDTWEGANLIPNAVFADGSLEFDVKQYDGGTGFPPIDVPGFYYRSGNIMAMALSADALAALVDGSSNTPAAAKPGGSQTSDLLYRGDATDSLTQEAPLAGLLKILIRAYGHFTADRLFTAGFIFLLVGQPMALVMTAILLTSLKLLSLNPPITPSPAPEPADAEVPADSVGQSPAAAPDQPEVATPPENTTTSGGGLTVLVLVVIIILLLLLVGWWLMIGRSRRRTTTGPSSTPPIPVSSTQEEPSPFRPLIFVPGIMASAIQANTSHGPEPLWPPIGYSGDVRKCLETLQGTDPARLSIFDGSPNGLLPGIHLGLIGFLAGHGYRLDPGEGHPANLYIHAYNWLESCSVAANDLVKLIRRATAEHGVPPSIIAHSMGGLVTRAALNDGQVEVDKVFYDASPHLGAPMAYYSIHPDIPYKFLPGWGGAALNAGYATVTTSAAFDLPMVDDDSWAITKAVWAAAKAVELGVETVAHALGGTDAFDAQMKLISQNATGVFELLPDELYFDNINAEWPVVTHKRKWYQRFGSHERRDYVPSSAAEAYRSDGPKDLPALPVHLTGKVDAALAFKASISKPLPPGGPDRTFVIYGAEHETVCEAVMTDDGPADERGDVECTLGGDQKGDGTVPTESGRGEPLWGSGVEVERDNTAEHFMMTETARFHGILTQHLPHGGRRSTPA